MLRHTSSRQLAALWEKMAISKRVELKLTLRPTSTVFRRMPMRSWITVTARVAVLAFHCRLLSRISCSREPSSAALSAAKTGGGRETGSDAWYAPKPANFHGKSATFRGIIPISRKVRFGGHNVLSFSARPNRQLIAERRIEPHGCGPREPESAMLHPSACVAVANEALKRQHEGAPCGVSSGGA
jgi:hypothetical protein